MSDLVPRDKEIVAKFEPRARLLLQLGDQLIKNNVVAIIELVKNSYDADAKKVDIYMENVDSKADGIIIIEDDGCGMTAEVVENVWLEPGSDFKKKLIEANKVSDKYKRLPIGEKGIGRFGVHKLGSIIEMTTKSKESKEVFVRIDWKDFEEATYLKNVPVTIIERAIPRVFKNNKTGTNIVISELRSTWTRGEAREARRAITSLISPFKTVSSFNPSFEIIDKPGWFEGLLGWKEINSSSLFTFKIKIKGNKLIKFEYSFIPWDSMSKVKGRVIDLDHPLTANFQPLEDSDGNHISLSSAQIGEILFEGSIFELENYILSMGVNDKKGFKANLNHNGGIRVFRDGLRIYDYGEPENDWLGLDLRRVNEPSKRMSNNLIIGAVFLDREQSTDLVEKTNREGFVENNAYSLLKNALLHCIKLIETFRYDDKLRLKSIYGPTKKSSPVLAQLEELKQFLDKKILDTPSKKRANSYIKKISDDYLKVSENLLKAAGAGLGLSIVVHEVDKIIGELKTVVEKESSSDRIVKIVQHLSSLIGGYVEIIRDTSRKNENIESIIDQALFNAEYRMGSHDVTLVKKYKSFGKGRKVSVSRSLLIGTIVNVIDNSIYWLERAYKANSDLKKSIFINMEEDANYLYIVVADNGTGFLIETENVTEPFVTGKPDGVGLGLHIASEVMASQKGLLLFPDKGDFEIPSLFSDGAIVALALKK